MMIMIPYLEKRKIKWQFYTENGHCEWSINQVLHANLLIYWNQQKFELISYIEINRNNYLWQFFSFSKLHNLHVELFEIILKILFIYSLVIHYSIIRFFIESSAHHIFRVVCICNLTVSLTIGQLSQRQNVSKHC